MSVDQSLWLFFAVAVFLAAVLFFVVIPGRIAKNRRRLRDVAQKEPPVTAAATAREDPPAPAPVPQPVIVPADGPPDDLRQIKGIGPKLAAMLGEMGITRFSQIAAMSEADLAALDARLGAFQGRPARDRWQEQARLLADGDRKGFERLHGKLGPGA